MFFSLDKKMQVISHTTAQFQEKLLFVGKESWIEEGFFQNSYFV
jgi:hypothetical protein